MDRNFNPFAISNKQAHIISRNLPGLRFLSHKWTFNSYFSSSLTQKSF